MRETILYCAPFVTWMGLLQFLPATAGAYALRGAITALIGIACFFIARRNKPTNLPTYSLTNFLLGAAAGLLMAVVWIAPEYSSFYCDYFTYGATLDDPSPYAPAQCGWQLTLAKLCASAFVIAPVEEIFFRSFLYRRIQSRDFLSVPLTRFDLSAFCWMVVIFTLEHNRPLVAAVAGALYGWLAIRRGIGSAIVAHVVTNFALGVYVIRFNEWAFW